MDAAELARQVKDAGLDIPVVLLAWDTRELRDFEARADTSAIERTFLWQGDARILVAIVKSVEDRRNVEHDTGAVGVQVILLIEDNVRYYSSFLPVIYTELLQHSQRVIPEGLNLSQKILRMRARPKILLCTTWEEAEEVFERYAEDVLGIISDIEFPRDGAKSVGGRERTSPGRSAPPTPTSRSSSSPPGRRPRPWPQGGGELPAQGLAAPPAGAAQGHARGLRLRRLRLPDAEGTRARPGRRPPRARGEAGHRPPESVARHAGRNHFSRWLKARTEFALAHELRPRQAERLPGRRGAAGAASSRRSRATAGSRARSWSPTSTATTST